MKTMRKIGFGILIAITMLAYAGSAVAQSDKSDKSDKSSKSSKSGKRGNNSKGLPGEVSILQTTVVDLQEQITDITLLPGPQGDPGSKVISVICSCRSTTVACNTSTSLWKPCFLLMKPYLNQNQKD